MSEVTRESRGTAGISRRRLIQGGAGVTAGSIATVALPAKAWAGGATSDDDDHLPYAIPWLDRLLHHNQVPSLNGPPTELSHVFHFEGTVGRALFTGQGTTGDGKTLYIGQGTDYGFASGKYLGANGDTYDASFAHI